MVIGLSGVKLGLLSYEWLSKTDNRVVGVLFVDHEYNYRHGYDTKSCYQ